MTSLLACPMLLLITGFQLASTGSRDCGYEYRYEDSVLRFCDVKVKSELAHPDARFPVVTVFGFLQNLSNHTWARVRFEVHVEGIDAINSRSFSYKWTVVKETIPKGTTMRFSEDIPYSVELPKHLIGLKASVLVLDEYTFPKVELLQATIEAEQVEKEKLERLQAIKEKQRLNQLQRQASQQRSELAKKCAAVFDATSQKKLVDITVVESQSIETCRSLGLYRPLAKTIIRPSGRIQ